ncbi:T-cell surface antigen CD2-like isoform X2 [Pungitius pungitius]|uniref:T-cell surface antigen CD2-like isoform X2 n=1 Tax=Pungitius pungitius TaxID=134920 RepID=UPI002E1230A4
MVASPGDMEAVVGLFVTLLGVSHGVETHCDGRQTRTQCFGGLGGTLVLQLMNNASEIKKYQWLKNKTIILQGNKNGIESNTTGNRSFFTPSNGTLRINNLSRTDGGEYRLETFRSDRKKSGPRFQQLTIQAPVSSVLLVYACLSHGERKLSCSSEGADSPQYSWTLDGHNLTDSELLGGNTERNIITLKQHVSGRLVCSVRNDVSSYSREETVSTCERILTTAAYVLAALVLLLVVVVSVVCAHKKKQKNKPKGEDNQELTCSEVRTGPRPGRQMKQRAEEEVEYGNVKFSQRPRHNVEPAAECVYANER